MKLRRGAVHALGWGGACVGWWVTVRCDRGRRWLGAGGMFVKGDRNQSEPIGINRINSDKF